MATYGLSMTADDEIVPKVLRPTFLTDDLPNSFPAGLRKAIARECSDNQYVSQAATTDVSGKGPTKLLKRSEAMPQSQCNLSTAMASNKVRFCGGRAPIPKKVVADMDSDDEIIWDMKVKGYKDVDVQRRLADEGRTLYHRKTISTRFARQRKVMEAYTDNLLDEQLTDWHVGEDEMLEEAYQEAEKQISAELKLVDSKLWTYTSEKLREKMGIPRYSAKACKDRYVARKNGTARPPVELDLNPDVRARQRSQILRAREKAKEVAASESQRRRDAQLANEEATRVAKEFAQKAKEGERLAQEVLKATERVLQEKKAMEIERLRQKALVEVQLLKSKSAKEALERQNVKKTKLRGNKLKKGRNAVQRRLSSRVQKTTSRAITTANGVASQKAPAEPKQLDETQKKKILSIKQPGKANKSITDKCIAGGMLKPKSRPRKAMETDPGVAFRDSNVSKAACIVPHSNGIVESEGKIIFSAAKNNTTQCVSAAE